MLGLFLIGYFVIQNISAILEFELQLLATCLEYNNFFLSRMSEADKVATAAGTTLVTLLPALLVFGPFPTAEISAMICYSTWPAVITSGFTLGLATSKMVTIGKNRLLRVIDLCIPSTIEYYGLTPINHDNKTITKSGLQ